MTLYSEEVQRYVRSRDWPVDFKLVVEENYTDVEGILVPYLQFVIFRHNWKDYDFQTQSRTASLMGEVLHKLRQDHIPCYLEARA